MYLIKDKKGFSLVEVIVSMAILSILAVAFLPLFGTSFANIFLFGEREGATSYASDKLELLYAGQPFASEGELKGVLDNGANGQDCSGGDLYDYDSGYDFNFCVEETTQPIDNYGSVIEPGEGLLEGYKVTIVVFYNNGESHIELSSFIRGD